MWIVVTGANGEIGQALCETFSKEGFRIFATDLQVKALGKNDFYFQMDLAEYVKNPQLQSSFLKALREQSAGSGVKGLINNAATQILGETKKISQADWQKTLDVNLTAPFLLSQSLVDDLQKTKGSILNISSVHALQTKPQFCAYATSKAALSGLTRSMAVDLGGGVRVNSLRPAAIETKMLKAGFEGKSELFAQLNQFHPSQRIGRPQEVAEFAVFIMSDRSEFINGADLSIDGAISARLHDPD